MKSLSIIYPYGLNSPAKNCDGDIFLYLHHFRELVNVTNPVDHQTADSNPVDHQTADSNPVDHQTADSNPVDHRTADSNPVDHQTADSNPVDH